MKWLFLLWMNELSVYLWLYVVLNDKVYNYGSPCCLFNMVPLLCVGLGGYNTTMCFIRTMTRIVNEVESVVCNVRWLARRCIQQHTNGRMLLLATHSTSYFTDVTCSDTYMLWSCWLVDKQETWLTALVRQPIELSLPYLHGTSCIH